MPWLWTVGVSEKPCSVDSKDLTENARVLCLDLQKSESGLRNTQEQFLVLGAAYDVRVLYFSLRSAFWHSFWWPSGSISPAFIHTVSLADFHGFWMSFELVLHRQDYFPDSFQTEMRDLSRCTARLLVELVYPGQGRLNSPSA